MEQLVLALMMAVTAEGLVEYGKSAAAALAGGGWRAAALQGGAAAVSVACFAGGMAASYALSIPAGASVVAANALCFGLSRLAGLALGRGRS